MPKVSVIIPAYNSERYIRSAINSVLSQTYKDFEIIVVDDGSSDNTKEIVNSSYPQLRYLYQKNKGPAAARNKGIVNSETEFVAFLDADDIWLPEKLELQMNEILSNESIGLVTCGGYIVDYLGNERAELRQINGLTREKLLDSLLIRNIIGGGSYVLVRKQCFHKVGLFDESLSVSEDRDMWFRICNAFEFRSIDKPLLRYLVIGNSQSSDPEKNIKSQLKFFYKIFSTEAFKKRIYFETIIYSKHFFTVAWSFLNSGDRKSAKKYILKSICTNPFNFLCSTEYIGLFIRIFFGEDSFKFLNKYIKK